VNRLAIKATSGVSVQQEETNMRRLMSRLAAAALVPGTTAGRADLGDQLILLLPDDGAAVHQIRDGRDCCARMRLCQL
jgi:hypothetical protein